MGPHVVFFSVGLPGHINPTLPIAAALIQRGCLVTFFTYATYRKQVEALGAVFSGKARK